MHYCTTVLLYYCTTALLHYCTTALLHYCTTAPCIQNKKVAKCLRFALSGTCCVNHCSLRMCACKKLSAPMTMPVRMAIWSYGYAYKKLPGPMPLRSYLWLPSSLSSIWCASTHTHANTYTHMHTHTHTRTHTRTHTYTYKGLYIPLKRTEQAHLQTCDVLHTRMN